MGHKNKNMDLQKKRRLFPRRVTKKEEGIVEFYPLSSDQLSYKRTILRTIEKQINALLRCLGGLLFRFPFTVL